MRLASLLLGLLLIAPVGAIALAPPVPVSPQDAALARATAVLHQGSWFGKDPQAWLDWAKGEVHPAAQRGASTGDMVSAVQSVYTAVGVQPTPAQLAELRARAASLDPRVASAFVPLVNAVAQAYALQAPVVKQLDWSAIQPGGSGVLLPPAAAQASIANGEHVLGAIAAFEQDVAALKLDANVPGFSDPLGLVKLGGTGNDVFLPDGVLRDPVLLADLGGDDVDYTTSGGACPLIVENNWATCNGLALSVHVDVAGNDVYHSSGDRIVAQGSGGFGGLGILVDAAGDDTYILDNHVAAPSYLLYYITGSSQGAGEAGVGIMIDAAGNDKYEFNMDAHGNDAFAQGQGYAGVGGFGMLLDGTGDDQYLSDARCDGGSFCGLYVDAVALYPGVAILLDLQGNDKVHAVVVGGQEDYYSQSFSAFGGLTLEVDEAGNDDYYASATSINGGPDLNCAFGTAEYAGAVSIFLDLAGDDRYYDETIAPAGASGPTTMVEGYSVASYSLFWDVSGNDVHSSFAQGSHPVLSGRGLARGLTETDATYLDTGGLDTYSDYTQVVGQNPVKQFLGADSRIWGTPPGGTHGVGLDQNLVPNLPL